MKNYLPPLIIIFLISACGPSSQEKEEIAVLACNIMGESRNMDASFRIKEINNAREQIGEERFLGKNEEIKESFEYGLCRELVLNDSTYKSQLSMSKKAERDKIEEKIRKEEAFHRRKLQDFKVAKGEHVLKCSTVYTGVNFNTKQYTVQQREPLLTKNSDRMIPMENLRVSDTEISWIRDFVDFYTTWTYNFESSLKVTTSSTKIVTSNRNKEEHSATKPVHCKIISL